jgi:hypothetical protein
VAAVSSLVRQSKQLLRRLLVRLLQRRLGGELIGVAALAAWHCHGTGSGRFRRRCFRSSTLPAVMVQAVQLLARLGLRPRRRLSD